MEPLTLLFLLLAVLFGSYIQTVTGFAMGMIIVATVGGLGLLQLSVLAILVSLLTSVNSLLSLRGNWSRIEFRFFLFLALGQFPAIVFGIELLNFLESNEVWILKVILGSFLVLGGLLSFINPRPLKRLSGRLTVFLAGILGGNVGRTFFSKWTGFRSFCLQSTYGCSSDKGNSVGQFFVYHDCQDGGRFFSRCDKP